MYIQDKVCLHTMHLYARFPNVEHQWMECMSNQPAYSTLLLVLQYILTPYPVIDMRLSPRDDHEAILKMVQGWLDEAGEGCTLKRLITDPKYPMTPTDDTDPWWKAFTTACVKQYAVLSGCVI